MNFFSHMKYFNENIEDSDLLVDSLRQLEVTPKSNGAVKTPDSNPDAFLEDENEIREMENWLKQQGGGSNLLGVSIFFNYYSFLSTKKLTLCLINKG
jgi:hypothetical protein